MFKIGQEVKTSGGTSVKIVAILDTPARNGFCIIGTYPGLDADEIGTWKADGAFMQNGRRSSLDLVVPLHIRTQHVHPPIPDRRFDYCAWYSDQDDEAGPRGWGATEVEAIADLKDNHPREDEAEAA